MGPCFQKTFSELNRVIHEKDNVYIWDKTRGYQDGTCYKRDGEIS